MMIQYSVGLWGSVRVERARAQIATLLEIERKAPDSSVWHRVEANWIGLRVQSNQ